MPGVSAQKANVMECVPGVSGMEWVSEQVNAGRAPTQMGVGANMKDGRGESPMYATPQEFGGFARTLALQGLACRIRTPGNRAVPLAPYDNKSDPWVFLV